MAFNFPYQQQYDYMQKLVVALKKRGIPKETITALAVNAYHESYLNPYTVEGAVNPGPPLGANGVDTGRDGLGLWQWTQQGNPLWSHLGDFDWQVNYMLTYKEQWDIYATWFRTAGLPDPTPNIKTFDDFLYNKCGYNDTQLTQAFIGYWERPDYTAGTNRVNSASSEAPQFRELVDKYYGGGGGGGGSKPNNNGSSNNDSTSTQKALEETKKAIVKEVYNLMKLSISKDLKKRVNSDDYGNRNVRVFKKFKDTMSIRLNLSLDDVIKKISGSLPNANTGGNSGGSGGGNNNNSGGGGDTNKDATYKSIINWCKSNMGKAYDYDAAHVGAGAQCVDLIKAISIYVLPNDPLRKALSSEGYATQQNAQEIYFHDLKGTGWTHAEGDSINDDNAVQLFNKLPNGAIVFWTYSTFGHVGVKCGNNMTIYNQNYAGKQYITIDQLESWQRSAGAGYLGAWVLE